MLELLSSALKSTCSVRLKPGMEMPNKCNNHPNISFTVSAPLLVSKSLCSPPAARDSLIHPCSWEKLQPSPCVWNQGKSVKSTKWSGITRQGTAPYRRILVHGGSHCWNSLVLFQDLADPDVTVNIIFPCCHLFKQIRLKLEDVPVWLRHNLPWQGGKVK